MMFDPNKDVDLWATYVKSRQPRFKVHMGRGPAINAVKTHSDREGTWPNDYRVIPDTVLLYRLDGGNWRQVDLIRHYKEGTDKIIEDKS